MPGAVALHGLAVVDCASADDDVVVGEVPTAPWVVAGLGRTLTAVALTTRTRVQAGSGVGSLPGAGFGHVAEVVQKSSCQVTVDA